MRLRHSMSCIACGLPLLTLAGCYSSPPYGSTGYPGYYSQPGGMGAPQMGGPQMGAPGSPPTLVNPGGNGSAPGPSSQGWQQPTQTWDPKDQNSGKVPSADSLNLPSLDSPKPSPEDVPTFEEKQTPMHTPGGGVSLPQSRYGRVATNVESKRLDFQPPIDVTPASSNHPSVQLASAESQSGPSPYAFDGDKYRFLQGVVEYDANDKAWHVMYSAEPDSHDKFGGDISLVDHPGLKGLRDQDVVYVEGHVDPQARDSHGKPRYRIDHMRKLVPKTGAIAAR